MRACYGHAYDGPMQIVVHGIPNCDTVRKARVWLDAQGVAYRYHDFRQAGVPSDRLARWAQSPGWDRLLNRRGTTWRKLDPAAQAAVVDGASAMALMQAEPSLIKRPVVDWGAETTVGFDPADWAARTGR